MRLVSPENVQNSIDLLREGVLTQDKINSALSVVSQATEITDVEWLYELFASGAATTPEQAVMLFRQEWDENYAPFR